MKSVVFEIIALLKNVKSRGSRDVCAKERGLVQDIHPPLHQKVTIKAVVSMHSIGHLESGDSIGDLETERLLLKCITPSSLKQLFTSKTKPQFMEYLGVDENAYNVYVSMHEKGCETYRLSVYFFVLVDKTTQAPIGECGFHTWNSRHHWAEVFYKIHQECNKRKGYITEALTAVLKFGYSQLKLYRIQALIASDNEPSLKLARRFGFQREGTIRGDWFVEETGTYEDSDCYSLLKPEWEKLNL
jgi:ribosomal-protein-alanine N-acetyltransferase